MKKQLAATLAITAAVILTPTAAHAIITILQPTSVASSIGTNLFNDINKLFFFF